MNLFDLLVILFAVSAAVGGYRLGFLARGISWLGLLIGGFIGYLLVVSDLTKRLEGASEASIVLLVVATLLGCALVGQGLGLTLGSKMHVSLPQGPLRRADRVAGSVLGAFGVLVILWVLLPTLAAAPGWTAEQARSSFIAAEVDEFFPDPPDAAQALRRVVGDGGFPAVFNELLPAPNLGPAPAASGLNQQLAETVAQSTVKVRGEACNRIQEGSGFVVAEDLVVTNAHVVAGEDDTEVLLNDGSSEDGTVVAYDPARDIAVLRVDNLAPPPLDLRDADIGDIGGVFGHPGGGPLEISPFKVGEEIRASGKDIYDRQDSLRQVLVLASELRPGDSGAALVDAQGNVIGMAFAVAPDKHDVAYALSLDELRAVLNGDLRAERDTGDCLV